MAKVHIVFTPERDSDNSSPPEATVSKTLDGSVKFQFSDKTIVIAAGDWKAIKETF